MRSLTLAGTILSCLLMISCGSDGKKGSNPAPAPNPTPTPTPTPNPGPDPRADGSPIADEMGRFIAKYCVECHNPDNNSAGIDLTNVNGLSENGETIFASIDSGRMPMDEEITAEEMEIVRAWRDAGFPRPNPASLIPDNNAGPDAPGGDNDGKNDHDKGKYCDEDYDKDDGHKKKFFDWKKKLKCKFWDIKNEKDFDKKD